MIGAIILAAGASLRMGRSKQMLDIHGQPMLRRTVETVANANINPIVVVLGANNDEHRRILESAGVDIVYNADWQSGMGTSIRAGMQALLTRYLNLSGVAIFVCDQPLLTPSVIAHIIAASVRTGKPIIASHYSEGAGVPALFTSTYFERLMRLPDESGAKILINQNPGDVELVSFPGGEIDMDTIEDYDRFRNEVL